MLQISRKFNDYDYALVHLFETEPDYYNFFVESLKLGRHVLLDNSVFELGEAFEEEGYVKWINKLQPTEWIIPDVLNNSTATIRNVEEWVKKYPNLPGKKIGVVQGESKKATLDCYRAIEPLVDKVAFSFDSTFHVSAGSTENKNVQYCNGRINLIEEMFQKGIINTEKPHHLLGCSLPQEFNFYTEFKWIDTIDTSNPIVHGLFAIPYEVYGLDDKKSIKLVELFDAVPTYKQMSVITHNLNKFREFTNA